MSIQKSKSKSLNKVKSNTQKNEKSVSNELTYENLQDKLKKYPV